VHVIISSYFLIFLFFFSIFFHSSYTITDCPCYILFNIFRYIGYCMSFENVFYCMFACTFDMCIKLLLTYLLCIDEDDDAAVEARIQIG